MKYHILRDKQVSELTNNVNTITEEKKGLEDKVAELTAQLEQANKDLEAAKAASKEEKKEEPKTEAPKKEEKKEEAKTEAPKL